MKILYHHRTLGDGAEGIHIKEMVQAFKEIGHDVKIIGPVRTGGKKEVSVSFLSKVKTVFKKIYIYELLEIAYNLYGYLKLGKAVKEFCPDVIYDRYMIFNVSTLAIGKRYKIPVILEINAPLAYERDHEPDETLVFSKLAYRLEMFIVKNAPLAVAVSTPLKKYFLDKGVCSSQIWVLPNGVNTAAFYPVKKSSRILSSLNIPESAFIIGFSGILRSWHGLDLLVTSFSEIKKLYPDVFLLLVGDGDVRNRILDLSEKLGVVESIRITGRISHEMVRHYVALFDVAVSPGTTFYASPMKIPEYMAMGKVVVAPDSENIRDMIADGETGILFRPDDAMSLSRSISKVITHPDLVEKIEKNGRAVIETKLNWKQNASICLEWLQCLKK